MCFAPDYYQLMQDAVDYWFLACNGGLLGKGMNASRSKAEFPLNTAENRFWRTTPSGAITWITTSHQSRCIIEGRASGLRITASQRHWNTSMTKKDGNKWKTRKEKLFFSQLKENCFSRKIWSIREVEIKKKWNERKNCKLKIYKTKFSSSSKS